MGGRRERRRCQPRTVRASRASSAVLCGTMAGRSSHRQRGVVSTPSLPLLPSFVSLVASYSLARGSAMPDTAGKKRAASEDFDSSAADARPPPGLRSGPFVPPDHAEEPANEVVRKAEGWIEQLESKVDTDEHVVLQTGEAKELVEDLRNLVAGCESLHVLL